MKTILLFILLFNITAVKAQEGGMYRDNTHQNEFNVVVGEQTAEITGWNYKISFQKTAEDKYVSEYGSILQNGTDRSLIITHKNGDVGSELWATDGTSSGTFLVSDLYQGTNNDSSPTRFYNFNGNIFFTAQTNYIGREFWSCGNFTTSIFEVEIDKYFTIFPNPAQNFVRISIAKGQIEAVQILDMYGKIFAESTKKDAEVKINISHLSSGVYLVKINTENGTAIKRFVKE